ncbi:MAG: YnbE family lipoprotein, partial [Bdellovibrionales bacterium]|nr:YnbE family lipoprotein [Bdellovibrionales bacterium]
MTQKATFISSLVALCLLAGCTPTVQVATEKPITINLNVKIDHEVRV